MARMNRNCNYLLLGLFGFCIATGVQAQVYKCRQGNAMVFTDRPCAEASSPLKGTAEAGPQGAIDFQVNTRHYSVSGPNLMSVYRAIQGSNPGGFAGWARWKVGYEYDSAEARGGCSLKRVTVRVAGEILMPQWVEEGAASAAEQHAWRTSYTGLKRHEDGHIQHGREFALLLKERLLGMGTVPCAELESRARQEYQLLYGNLENRDKEYDRRTNHGLRQDNPQ